MSRKKDDGGNDITFVVTTNPLASSAANKKRVRSVAALKSWPERRKKTFQHNQSRLSGSQGGFVLDLTEPVVEASSSAGKKRKLAPKDITSTTDSSQIADYRPLDPNDEPLFEKCTRATSPSCNCVHCRAERRRDGLAGQASPSEGRKRTADGQLKIRSSKRDAAMLIPHSSSRQPAIAMVHNVGRAEPFNQYPVPYRPWFDYVLDHMMNVFGPKGWPTLKISHAEGRRWEWFMTQHALSEPALFYVRLLFATGDLLRLGTVKPELAYWLKAQAVQTINEALSDPKRATSDALILAVGRIALHEHFYGDSNAATTLHRPAQKRMIVLRGGFNALPIPELVKKLMRWGDTVMSQLSGTDRLLEDDEENQNFSMKQHVDVLEQWAPQEGKELSTKIRISDLLSPEPSRAEPVRPP